MGESGLDIINDIATNSKSKKTKKGNPPQSEPMQSKQGASAAKTEKTKISFKKEKIRRVYKGSHLPEDLAVKIEEKSRLEGVSESFLIQKILEDWFTKHE